MATPNSSAMNTIWLRGSPLFTSCTWPFLIICITSYLCKVLCAVWNEKKPISDLTRRLRKRWSCSIILFKYLTCRSSTDEGSTPHTLSPIHNVEATKGFFVKALHITANSAPDACPIEEQMASPRPRPARPRVINVDKNATYPKAIADLKANGILPALSNSGKWNIWTTCSNKTFETYPILM